MPTVNPVARCWNVGSAQICEGMYRVAVPAVKRPCLTKYDWNSAGSTPFPAALPESFDARAEQFGKLTIEVDQLAGNCVALGRVGVQQCRRALALQDCRELPSQVESVLHGHVHALPGLRAVGMAGVAGDEDAREAGFHLLLRHIVELVAQALANLVNGPPGDVFDVQRVRMNDPVRGRDQLISGDVLRRQVLIGVELAELDIDADEVSAFARE